MIDSLYDLLQEAVQYDASDIHINHRIYFRVKKQLFAYPLSGKELSEAIENLWGDLVDFMPDIIAPKYHHSSVSAYKPMELSATICVEPRDSKSGARIRCRVSYFLQAGWPSFAIRVFRPSVPSLDELGSPPVLKSLALKESGLVLICGATGSGKSTTLAALVQHINLHARKHILTLEDPIEYMHESQQSCITQREIGLDSPDFQTALKASLRQNPDVIVIGEILDSIVLKQAINHSLSGHLVLASFHAKGAVHAITRILGLCQGEGGMHESLADCIVGVVTQRLLEGQSGIEADYEVLVSTPAVRTLVRENKISQLDSQISMGRAQGMRHFAGKIGDSL